MRVASCKLRVAKANFILQGQGKVRVASCELRVASCELQKLTLFYNIYLQSFSTLKNAF